MNIRHATEADVPVMMKIYEYARAFMAEDGNPNQWGKLAARRIDP